MRFNDDGNEPLTVARIDEILNKGDLADFLNFLSILIADPHGVRERQEEIRYGGNS